METSKTSSDRRFRGAISPRTGRLLLRATGGLVALVLAVALLAGRPWTADWLVLRHPPTRADLIVVFCGGGGRRMGHAIDLLRQGFANKILFLGTSDEMDFARSTVRRRRAEGLGKMVFVRRPLPTTFASVRFLRDYVLAERPGRILIVTSPHHGRRIEYCFTKLLQANRIERRYCPTPKEGGEAAPSRWLVALEYTKLLWYTVRY